MYPRLPMERSNAQHFWIRLALAVGLILVVAAAYSAGQSDQSKPSSTPSASSQPAFNRTWKLNRDESDDAREKLRAAIQDRDGNGGMGRHGGMGGGGIGMGIPGIGGIGGGGMGGPMGGPGGGMGRGPGSGAEEQHARLHDLVQAPEQLRIEQKGAEIDIIDAENHRRALFTDGRKIEKPKKDSPDTQVKARWQGQTLTTEEKGPNGEKISHAYELSSEGKSQLVDTLTVESKRLNTPIIIRSVYDSADAAKSE